VTRSETKFTDSRNGTLCCVPVALGAPRLVVRRFDGEIPPSLIPEYAAMTAAAAARIAADPQLTKLIRVEHPMEIGRDYIARRHFNATSLDALLETDPEEDPPEQPPELPMMQARFRERTKVANDACEALLTSILARSILERSLRTFYDEGAEQFVIADLEPTLAELERWQKLTA
jgi:hypothetical protein